MSEPSESRARLVLNAGNSPFDVYIDNISLVQVVPSQIPQAAFSADTTSGIGSLTVLFNDESGGTIETWLWDFGDGQTSSEQNPSHAYSSPGTYSVSLTVTGPEGSDTEIKEDFIVVNESVPIARFTADTTRGMRPFEVQFTDESEGAVSSWLWKFGDGNTSEDQHPRHTYISSDTFSVSLIVSGPGGIDSTTAIDYIYVLEPPPVASFSADTTIGIESLTVQFEDQSTGLINSWLWDFGDSTISREQSPSHHYSQAGAYTVSLTVDGPGGTDQELKENFIRISDLKPVAAFSADTTWGNLPFEVQFFDNSVGTIESWLWNFGDGTGSTEQNPKHVYLSADTFSVSLTVSGPGGDDTLILENFILVRIPSGLATTLNLPEEFQLQQNYPNPFNPFTRIDFGIPEKCHIELTVYDVVGQKVCTLLKGTKPAGYHSVRWDASLHSAGTYYIRMDYNTGRKSIKMMLIK